MTSFSITGSQKNIKGVENVRKTKTNSFYVDCRRVVFRFDIIQVLRVL